MDGIENCAMRRGGLDNDFTTTLPRDGLPVRPTRARTDMGLFTLARGVSEDGSTKWIGRPRRSGWRVVTPTDVPRHGVPVLAQAPCWSGTVDAAAWEV